MNQPISPPTSFLSFKLLGAPPTIPKKTSPPLLSFTPPTAPASAPSASAPSPPAPSASAPVPINSSDYMVNKTNFYDYIPIAVGLGVVYMMFKY